MTDSPVQNTQNLAAIAAIGQGDLSQIRILYDALDSRIAAVEQNATAAIAPHTHDLSSVEPVEPPPGDARSPEIREYLTTLCERFNALLEALKA